MIDIAVDVHALTGKLDALRERQIPFATMKALNECAKAFQADERKVIQRDFIIRRPWVLQGVKINRGDFATKQKLDVTVRIDPTRDFLDKFEAGGVRRPQSGAKGLVVPIAARATPSTVIPFSKRPRAFGFREVGGAKIATHASLLHRHIKSGVLRGAMKVYEGSSRTVLIQAPSGAGVILQRIGRGKHVGMRVLYVLSPYTRVPASLHFEETAQRSFLANWPGAFTTWWAAAIRTANPTSSTP